MNEYDGKQFVGIDLHRQRSVIVRQSSSSRRYGSSTTRWRCNYSSTTPAPTPRWCSKQRTDGTGRSTYCKRTERRCIWHTRWESKGLDP